MRLPLHFSVSDCCNSIDEIILTRVSEYDNSVFDFDANKALRDSGEWPKDKYYFNPFPEQPNTLKLERVRAALLKYPDSAMVELTVEETQLYFGEIK